MSERRDGRVESQRSEEREGREGSQKEGVMKRMKKWVLTKLRF